MDLIRRLERLATPDNSWEDARMGDWIYAMKVAAPHLNSNLDGAIAAFYAKPDDAELRQKLRDAFAAIRDWSITNGYRDVACQCFDPVINGLE